MAKIKRRARPRQGLVTILEGRTYRAVSDRINGPTSYRIAAGAVAIFTGERAPGAPGLLVAEVEYGGNETVRVEVGPDDYEFVE